MRARPRQVEERPRHMTSTETTGRAEATAAAKKAPQGSLSAALAGHRNSLGVLRLVLASLVIFSHAVPLGGWGTDPSLGWSRGQESIGGFAVVGFFAISGYLIAKSGASADVVQFFWRRVLRIFPAFWLVLIVAIVIVGPIAWVLEGHSLATYLSVGPGGPLAYFTSNWDLTIRQWGIHDIFAETPYGREVGGSVFNGSLWTLVHEWWCYVLIGVLVLFGVLTRARIIVAGITAFFFILTVATIAVPGAAGSVIAELGDPFRLKLGLVFMIGATLAMYSREIISDDRLGIFAIVIVIVTLRFGGWNIVGTAAFAYALLWLASRLPKAFQWIGAKNDYSYGVYVYGFLVQQMTASLGWYRMGYVPWVIATLVVTAGCAWLSWHLVEKRALWLKDWGPGRGVRYWYEWSKARVTRPRRVRETAPAASPAPELD
jgi:peptidoglycan/LPS O-acetylase OafA/YrhL